MLIPRLHWSTKLFACSRSIVRPYSSSTGRPKFNILFCGTDEFSVESLRAVLQEKGIWEQVHVVTPPERKHGRGGSQTFIPPLSEFARDQGLSSSIYIPPVRPAAPTAFGLNQTSSRENPPHLKREEISAAGSDNGGLNTSSPTALSQPEAESPSASTALPDWCCSSHPSNLIITSSFGHILPDSFLRPFPPDQRLNVHPSLLPYYRGAAPIQWAIANGERETGVTVQSLADKPRGVDTGEILGQIKAVRITDTTTYKELYDTLGLAGGQILSRVLRDLRNGTEVRTAQGVIPSREALLQIGKAPKIIAEDGHIDWRAQSAATLDRLHRGIGHQAPLWTEHSGVRIQLLDPVLISPDRVPLSLRSHLRGHDYNPGRGWLDTSPTSDGNRIMIACISHGIDQTSNSWFTHKAQGNSWLEVRNVKPSGSRQMSVRDFWNGLPSADRVRNWTQFKNRRHEVEPFISHRNIDGSLPDENLPRTAARNASFMPTGKWGSNLLYKKDSGPRGLRTSSWSERV